MASDDFESSFINSILNVTGEQPLNNQRNQLMLQYTIRTATELSYSFQQSIWKYLKSQKNKNKLTQISKCKIIKKRNNEKEIRK